MQLKLEKARNRKSIEFNHIALTLFSMQCEVKIGFCSTEWHGLIYGFRRLLWLLFGKYIGEGTVVKQDLFQRQLQFAEQEKMVVWARC